MRLFPIITAILVVGVLFLLVFQRDALVSFSGAEPETTEAEVIDAVADRDESAPPSAVSVVAIRSSASSIDGAVILRGRTEAARQVDMRAETSGQVISDPLRAGARVEEGDLLCRLDPGTRAIALAEAQAGLREAITRLPEAEARVAEARARLTEAEINDNAAERLSQGGFASDTRVAQATASVESARAGVQSAISGVESARSGIQSAEARVAAAQNQLDQLEVRAPFGGILETDSAEIGSLMQPGSLCATIIQLDPIKMVGFVPETMVERVTLGALAGARLASGREVVGRVTFLSRSADPNTRTFRVDVEVANPDFSISDGQTAEIAIQSEGTSAHLLPQSALTLNDNGDLGVRLAVENVATFAPVSVLRDTIEGIWVNGLAPSVDVIVVGQEFVTEGVPVNVTYREEATQ
ncbi:efflux RND transporter periplasmic adaptor subunit [Boseongicola aestuarii]|jgi:multidrug efflux system membrane fusion protein|uniref:Multidrug resistance protein MdtA n=1 Tax=Boseongicola aestuarii TaxID=1470561 RepID=A0A238IVA9_9RHOB|nr:efflux RND transporter periplasmic adaptor subunit [Boseongicola aestuarii]SMX22409.1 Multidrug resistance protein MdtA precursor [Boseongicola aestuarii]